MAFRLHSREWPCRSSARRSPNYGCGKLDILAQHDELRVVHHHTSRAARSVWRSGLGLAGPQVHTAREHGNLDLSTLDGELRAMLHGSHSLYEPGLGLTMADGG